MSVRVVVEGPDGGGKSNLVERLVEATGLPILQRASDSEKGPIANIGEYIENDLMFNHDVRGIYDRHPLISELIYGPTCRGWMKWADVASETDREWLTEMLALFYSYQPVLIYCLPPWYRVFDHVMASVQMEGVRENCQEIYELYVAQACRDLWRPNVWVWNYMAPRNYNAILRAVEVAKDA